MNRDGTRASVFDVGPAEGHRWKTLLRHIVVFLKPAFACRPPPAPPHWVGREPDEAQDDVPIPASHPRPRHQTSLGLQLTSRCSNTVSLSHVVYVMPFMNCGRKRFYVARHVHVQCVKRFLFSTSWK